MASPWKFTTSEVPADTDVVWIVRLPYFDKPIQATYNAATQQFFYGDNDGFTQFLPAYAIFKWRPL